MSKEKLKICFARRGYSASGGAESYLKRLGQGIVGLGHEAQLFTTIDWGESEWTFGKIIRSNARSPIAFADALEKMRPEISCDVLVSLERVWQCDVYRAGDGVHQSWMDRRKRRQNPWQRFLGRFNRKQSDLLRLEKALLDDRRAERVIANSQMVKNEIVDLYNYRPDKIDIVRNGVPVEQFGFSPDLRHNARTHFNLAPDDIALLFVGTGWERKGLRFAIDAIESARNSKLRLLVAGRGSQQQYQSATKTQFLGEVADLRPVYAAADVFILPTVYDPFSNACLEALASGLPVITTRANGFSEIIEDKIHGSIVDVPDNVAELRQAIQLWTDGTRRSAARSSILKRASQFDISRNVEQTLAILVQTAAKAAST